MKRVLLHYNYRRNSQFVKNKLEKLLKSRGKILTKKNPDVIVVIGGDGTMLSAIRKHGNRGIPFVGVDTGSLGFLPTLLPAELDKIFDIMDQKNYRIESYPLLKVVSTTIKGEQCVDYAFNEVLIKHMEPRLMEAKLYINEKPFNYFTGDGFIISTPIGSTGYAIWAGGNAVHSELPVYQITPIHPNDNSINRPMKSAMIVPDNTVLDLHIVKANKRKVIVACDGNNLSNEFISDIHVAVDQERRIKVIRHDDYDYFDLFKRKIIDKNVTRYIY